MSAGPSTDARRVCVVGLGRIGLPTAILCHRAGHEVVGVEVDSQLRSHFAQGGVPYDEPDIGYNELKGLTVVPVVDDVHADVYILCVGTSQEGSVDPTVVLDIAARLPSPDGALIVVESTIPPGTCRRIERMGHEYVAHCPERARPGEVMHDFATLPRLIGGVDAASTKRAHDFYETLTDAPLIDCSADEAALAKLTENAEREIRIAFANELADIAWQYDLDGPRIAELAASHPRTAMLHSGVGVGGRCLPMATEFFASRGSGLAERTRDLHERRPQAIARRIAEQLEAGSTICVLGRGYRANVAHVEGETTPATELIDALQELGLNVTSYDWADASAALFEELIDDADAYFVAVEHDMFQGLDDAKRIVVI